MGSELNPEFINGLLIPEWDSSRLWDAESSYTQAGPQPGVPVEQQATSMVLATSGTQSANQTLKIRTTTGGHPRLGGAQFHWRYGVDDWRGCDTPNVITHSRVLLFADGTGSDPVSADQFHILPLISGKVIVAYRRQENLSPDRRDVYVTRLTESTGAWGTHYAVSALNTAFDMHPCLVQLPSGRVLCFFFVKDTTADEWNVRGRYSDDDGETWDTISLHSLITPISADGSTGYTVNRLRAAYKNGQILMIAHVTSNDATPTTRETLMQFASDDLGCTFTLVKDFGLTGAGYGFPDLAVHDGFFYLAHLQSGLAIDVRRVASAYDDLESTNFVEGPVATVDYAVYASKLFSEGDLAMWRDDNGALYLMANFYVGAFTYRDTVVHRSEDGGVTWDDMGTASPMSPWTGSIVFRPNSTSDAYMSRFAACAAHGRSYVVHGTDGQVADTDHVMYLSAIGGYTTVPMAPSENTITPQTQTYFTDSWLPFDEPQNMGWTRTTTGGTDTLGSAGNRIVTTAQTLYYSKTGLTGTPTEGIVARFAVSVVSGGAHGALGTNSISWQCELDDGSAGITKVAIRFSTTGFSVHDATGVTLVQSNDIDMTERVDFLVAVQEGSVNVWYLENGNFMLTDREWVDGGSSTSLGTDATSTVATIDVHWGHRSSTTSTSDWWEHHFVTDEYTGRAFDADVGIGNGDEMIGREVVTLPQYVDDGVSIHAIDGPAFRNDEWSIPTRYTYAIENVFTDVEPSPRVTWRSTNVAAAVNIAFQLDGNGDDQFLQNDIFAVVLEGINFAAVNIQGYQAGAWSTIATAKADINAEATPFVRFGDTIRSNYTDPNAFQVPYYEYGELVGGFVDIGSGTKFRKIIHNTEGFWADGVSRQCVITLDGVDGTEASSGTLDIYSPRLAAVIHNEGNKYEGIRVQIATAYANGIDGYFAIGQLIAGPIAAFGWQTSWGRSLELIPNVEVATASDGSRRSRVAGPPRRSIEVAWADGVDSSNVMKNQDDNYVIHTTDAAGEPVALRSDAAYLVPALVDYLDGPHTPIVWLPYIDPGTGAIVRYAYNRRRDWIYGRIVSDITVESIQGDENQDEVFRVQAVRVEEEV